MKLPILAPHNKSWLIFWGLGVLAMLIPVVASQMGPQMVEWFIVSPFGLTENMPTIFILFGLAYAIAIARLPSARHLRGWMIVYAIAIIFFAGEDQNWFQYWFDTEVPNYFLVNNKEQETNLHNINSWFNQKPRLMVELWLLIACILVPMGWWTWPQTATKQWVPAALWPDRRIVPLAIITLLVGQLRRVFKHLTDAGVSIPDMALADEHHVMIEILPGVRISELEEIGFAYLMALFVAMLYGHLVSQKAAQKPKLRTKKLK